MSSELVGKVISSVSFKITKIGNIPVSYLYNKPLLSRTFYYPDGVNINYRSNYNEIYRDLFYIDLELDSEEIRLRYENASYNLRRFLNLTGM